MTLPIGVLVVDDQALIRTGFRMILGEIPDIHVVGEAIDGADAVNKAVALHPDVVLMDVRMPGTDGIEATRRIVEQTTSRVLILTTFDLDEYAFEGLRAGASGFLLKDVAPAALSDAIRAVAAGDAVLTPRITRDLVDQFARTSTQQQTTPDALTSLTTREREVFALIADGLSNGEIARSLHLTEATVKTYITHLLGKLRLRDRVQVVIYAYQNGFR